MGKNATFIESAKFNDFQPGKVTGSGKSFTKCGYFLPGGHIQPLKALTDADMAEVLAACGASQPAAKMGKHTLDKQRTFDL